MLIGGCSDELWWLWSVGGDGGWVVIGGCSDELWWLWSVGGDGGSGW